MRDAECYLTGNESDAIVPISMCIDTELKYFPKDLDWERRKALTQSDGLDLSLHLAFLGLDLDMRISYRNVDRVQRGNDMEVGGGSS